ncbi:hypothetical protein GCM10020218_093400 [Dactylosporangium vinaceum]
MTVEDKGLTLFVQADGPLHKVLRPNHTPGDAGPLAMVAEIDWDGGDALVLRNRGTDVIRGFRGRAAWADGPPRQPR